MKKTEPEFLRTISNMSNTASNAFTQMSPPKKMKVDSMSTSSNKPTERRKTSKQDESESNMKSQKPKVIKIDAKELSDLISRKKLIISRPSRTSTATVNQKQVNEVSEINHSYYYLEDQFGRSVFQLDNKLDYGRLFFHVPKIEINTLVAFLIYERLIHYLDFYYL